MSKTSLNSCRTASPLAWLPGWPPAHITGIESTANTLYRIIHQLSSITDALLGGSGQLRLDHQHACRAAEDQRRTMLHAVMQPDARERRKHLLIARSSSNHSSAAVGALYLVSGAVVPVWCFNSCVQLCNSSIRNSCNHSSSNGGMHIVDWALHGS